MKMILTAASAALLIALPAAGGGNVPENIIHTAQYWTGAAGQGETDLVEAAASTGAFTTLLAAAEAAGIDSELKAEGPYTVFAPVNAAFDALPPGTVEDLLKPENKDKLVAVLTYHVVAGKFTAADVVNAIKAGGGKATLATVEGETLTFTEVQGNIKVDGTQGSSGFITQPDVEQSNGNIHVINGVLMPTLG